MQLSERPRFWTECSHWTMLESRLRCRQLISLSTGMPRTTMLAQHPPTMASLSRRVQEPGVAISFKNLLPHLWVLLQR